MSTKKIVVLGGGTGLSAMLRGIKYINDIDITAIVTVADSGGSTGILSRHFDIPAVGDLRRVIASLSKNREELERSMEFRINGTGSDLDGHTIGNLILASQIQMNKDFSKGIKAATRMLNIEGTILPVSSNFEHLQAEMKDGTIISNEDKIGHSTQPIKRLFYKNGKASLDAADAIEKADYIIFGIGSLYTSLIANLIYDEIIEALKKTQAKIIYFANIFTQHGETDEMKLSDHIKAIEDHTFKNIIDETIVSNTKIPQDILESYINDHQFLVENDIKGTKNYDLISWDDKLTVRHNEDKIKDVVESLIKK